MEKLAKKFFENNGRLESLGKVYLKLRRLFQDYGWSEKDLEKVPYMTEDLVNLQGKFQNILHKSLQELKEQGFDIKEREFNSYLRKFLSKINELTPLSDVDYKRTDTGNEDY